MTTSHDVHRDGAPNHDQLRRIGNAFISSIQLEEYDQALEIVLTDTAALWFAIPPADTEKLFKHLAANIDITSLPIRDLLAVINSARSENFQDDDAWPPMNHPAAPPIFTTVILKIHQLRKQGELPAALTLSKKFRQHLGGMQPLFTSDDGWSLQATLQVGISAMLAGNFSEALTAFTRAQLHPEVPKFTFLARDARVKAALIHACFGNVTTAASLLKSVPEIPRTSSWFETHVDAHQHMAEMLANLQDSNEAISRLDSIDPEAIGELWPFYIVIMYRILEATGRHDEIPARLEYFDNRKQFPRNNGEGFPGSILPIKRALLAMKDGHGAKIQHHLDQADHSLPYTQLVQAAGHLYAGQTQTAIQLTSQLRSATRGFRLLELRRLAILAAAQYQSQSQEECLVTLDRAANLPRGLTPHEVQFFSPETRDLAQQHISVWPVDVHEASTFLTNLPKPGAELTVREIEIVRHLADGHTRAEMAQILDISVNTLKTHLRSIYKKLGVASAKDAISSVQQRGLL